jgi:hypothetical protein
MEEEEMATEQKDAPPAQIESELAPPVAFTVIHSDESAADPLEPARLSDVDGEPDIEGAPDVEPDRAETTSASTTETESEVRADVEDAVVDAPTAPVRHQALANAFEPDLAAARDSMVAVNVKVLQAFLTNAETSLDFLAALPSVKSLSELIALQSKFASKQVDALMRPAAEIGAMTQTTMVNTFGATRNQITRSVGN